MSAVLFGTLLAAPLLLSLDATRRRLGFVCMAVGSLSALVATGFSGLWILAFANFFWFGSSLRGFIVLSQSTADIAPPMAEQQIMQSESAFAVVAEAVEQTVTDIIDGGPDDRQMV
ncbi:MAG: hypothetical protein ACON4V_05205 [Parvibaculales bacterium]